MGTVTTTLAWPTGIDGTDLTSWAGDAVFSTTPVAGDVVAGSDTLTIAADGTVAGPDGNHTLTHLLADGSAQSLTYLIGADTTAPVLSSPTATQTGQATADASVSTDEDNGNLFWLTTDTATELAEDVISLGESQAVGSTGVQTVAVTGLTAGSPYYTHFVHRDAVGNNSTRVSSAQFTTASPVPVDVTASTTLVAPAGHFYVTTGTTPDYKIFSDNGWTAGEYPQPGEIFLWDNVDITFSEDLVPTGNTESSTVYCAVIRVDGAADGFTLDASQIPEVQITDTTPTQFTFTDLNNLPTGAERESNAITISGVDPATDIPASITGGEYAVSTDDGATFGAYTSAATNVQLDDQIKVRVTTSANNSTGTSAAFTAGGVTDTFTATTEAEAAQVPQGTITFGSETIDGSSISQPFSYSLSDQSSFESRIDGGAAQAATSPVVVNSLAYSQTVQIEIRAINETGSGDWSSVSHTTTAEPDTTAPVVALTGGDTSVVQGETYTPPTVTVTDDTDSGLTATPDITVNTATLGAQVVTYSATDAAGNTGTAQHTVTIIAPIPDGIGVGYTNVINPDMTFGIATTLTDPQAGEFLLAGIIIDGTKYDLQILSWDAGTLTVKAPNNLPLSASPELTVERARVSV